MTAQQHAALFAAASPEVATVLTALWTTGASSDHLCRAEKDNIIDGQDGMKLVFAGPIRREVFVPPKTATEIRSLIATNGNGPILRNRDGRSLTPQFLRNALCRLCRKVGVGPIPPRAYRHSVVERLRVAGVRPDVIGRVLGHSIPFDQRWRGPNDSEVWAAVKLLEE